MPVIGANYRFLATSRHAGDRSYQAVRHSPGTIPQGERLRSGEPVRCRQTNDIRQVKGNYYHYNRHTYGYEDIFPDSQTLARMLFIRPCLLTLPFEVCAPLSLEHTPQSQLPVSSLFSGQAMSPRVVSPASTRQIYPLGPRDYPVCVVLGSGCDSRLSRSALAMRYREDGQSSTGEQNEYNTAAILILTLLTMVNSM